MKQFCVVLSLLRVNQKIPEVMSDSASHLWIAWAFFRREQGASILMTRAHYCPYFSLQAIFRDQSIAMQVFTGRIHANLHLCFVPVSRLAFSYAVGVQGLVILLIVKAKCTAARTGQDQTAAPVTHQWSLSSHCLKRNAVCLSVYLESSRLLNVSMHVGGSGLWMLHECVI